MKSTELRIGSWVTIVKDNVYDNYDYELTGFDIYKLDESECADILPIPLTEEWLLKFGFEKQMDEDYVIDLKKGCQLAFDIKYKKCYIGESVEWGSPRIDYNHVHQLQNLYFALTGEELTIKE